MPEFIINTTRPATVACQYRVSAADEHEAMRMVYGAQVQPSIVALDYAGIPGTGDSIKEIVEVRRP